MPCRIWQLANQTHTQMMGYVVKTETALVVIDGGTAGDAPFLLHILREAGGEKPHVDAWFLTHPHLDHVDAFLRLMKEERGAFSVEQVCLRFPERGLLERGEPGCLHTWDAYQAARPLFLDKERLLNAGETFSIGDTKWEVLYVTDPTIEKNASNNSSLVLRLTAEGVSTLFLADLGKEGGEVLLKRHGGALKSDIVQMAHHGQSAVYMDVYEAIRPDVCLWCAPRWLWENDQGHRGYDSGVWDILSVREKMAALGVRRHVVHKDGTALLTLDQGSISAACWHPFSAL